MFSSRRIIGIYLVFATLWIWIGDQLVAVLVPSLEYVTIWQMAKGVLFVAISGLLLTILMKRQFRIIQQASEQMQRYMRRLELLRQLDKALLSAESPQEVTHTAVERIREMTPCYHVSMTLFDADSNMAFVSAASTVATSYFQEEQRFSFVRGIEVLRSGQVFQVDDIQQLVELTPTEKLLQKEGIRSYIHIPVQVRGRLTGTINLVDRVPQRFSAEDIAIASEVTTRVSLALQQAQLLEHARDENIRLESLRQAGLRLSESLSLEDVFHQILDSALKLCDHIDVVYIYMYQNDTLTIGHSFVRSGSHTHEAYQPRQNGVHYAVAHTGSTIVVEDLAQDTRFNNTAQSYSGTIVALPLKIGTQVIGVLSVYNYQPCSFSVHDISLFRLLSDQASLTLHNALLHEQMRLDISQLESLRQVSLYLTSHLELQPVLDVILEYTLSLTEAKNAHIFLYDGDKLTFGAAMWEGKKKEQPFKEVRPEGLTYQVARSGQMLVIPDMNNHELYADIDYTGAIVGIPLLMQGKVRGVMNISYNEPHAFSEQELNLMELISDQAAIAIHNAWLYEELQRHADEMERRVEERTIELKTANVRLTEYDRLRSKFVSDLSHELRTPVSSLNVRLYLMERSAPEQYPNHIAALKTQIDLLNDFIQNALDISRLDLEPTHVTLAAVHLTQVIQAVVSAYREAAEANGVQLLFEPDNDLPPIQGEYNHLSQMVTHLVSNAVRYTTKGHIKIAAQLDEAKNHICITVEDTGMGIHEDDIPYIFDRFYRGQQVAQLLPGTGLGLSIVQMIVKLHSGWIDVQSQVGKGSTFSICLPTNMIFPKNGK